MLTEPDTFFSHREKQLLYDTEIFLLKRSATEKLYSVFGNMVTALKDTAIHKQFPFPAGIDSTTGKISKGENYLGYPYVVLDFPKLFGKENIFCYRSMFWFGHYFSFSLLLGGHALKHFEEAFFRNSSAFNGHEIYFSVFKDPWGHAVSDPYYVLIDTLKKDKIIQHIEENNYLKLTYRNMFSDPGDIITCATNTYNLFLGSLL
ncbi:MAG: hypothetical protein H7X71_04305 [Chitinophagales bacterium]|nr:hypothetical protein [Chitinophagales bacterium]